MIRWLMLLSLLLVGTQTHAPRPASSSPAAPDPNAPAYTAEGNLKYPDNYREWVFLTSGLDMSYSAGAAAATHSVFDNVFVNPGAYKAFLQTGVWPEGTMLVLENRGGEGNHSINIRGRTQTMEVTGFEVHVKDSSRMKAGWAFYGGFADQGSGKLIDRPATCYTCHEQHAAVDTTFVQFYPTLLGLAKQKGWLSPEYLKDEAAAAAK